MKGNTFEKTSEISDKILEITNSYEGTIRDVFLSETKLKKIIHKFYEVLTSLKEEELTIILNSIYKNTQILDKTNEEYDILSIIEKEIIRYFLINRPNDIFVEIDTLDETKRMIELPLWLKQLGYGLKYTINTLEEFVSIPKKTLLYDKEKNDILFVLGIDNLQKFNRETLIFSHIENDEPLFKTYFSLISDYISLVGRTKFYKDYLIPNYITFEKTIAFILNELKSKHYFIDYPSYDFIESSFRTKYHYLFINKEAPKELKNLFYANKISPNLLLENESWLNYLDYQTLSSLLDIKIDTNKLTNFFNSVGIKEAIKLLMINKETVIKMLDNDIETLKYWYFKTGKKFIPSYEVMTTLPLTLIDKYLSSMNKFNKLPKHKNTKALLKLAYIFGVFDSSTDSIKKINIFLNNIPEKITAIEYSKIELYETSIKKETQKSILKLIEKEGIKPLDTILNSVYEKSAECYSLKENLDDKPKTKKTLRTLLNNAKVSPVNINFAEDFDFILDMDFREFLLNNQDLILKSPELLMNLGKIQECFKTIKKELKEVTLPKALEYIKEHEITLETQKQPSTTLLYKEKDINNINSLLNEIKIAVDTNIYKEVSNFDNYEYQVLKLDDSLSLMNLNNHCNKLSTSYSTVNYDELKDGRVFVIKKNNELLTRDWLQEDEVKVYFKTIEKSSKITEEDSIKIKEIYNKSSKELIKISSIFYLSICENGMNNEKYKIMKTKELRGKNTLKLKDKITIEDLDIQFTPLFECPTPLSHNLYISNSKIMEIMDAEKKIKESLLEEEANSIFGEMPVIYDEKDFTKLPATNYQKLKVINGENFEYDSDNYMQVIARKFDIPLDKARIIMNPNYSIVYRTNDLIHVYDVVIKTKVKLESGVRDVRSSVIKQLRLGLSTIVNSGRDLDIGALPEEKQELIMETLGIKTESKGSE